MPYIIQKASGPRIILTRWSKTLFCGVRMWHRNIWYFPTIVSQNSQKLCSRVSTTVSMSPKQLNNYVRGCNTESWSFFRIIKTNNEQQRNTYIRVCPCKTWFFEESSIHHSPTDLSLLPEATHLLSRLNATLLTESNKMKEIVLCIHHKFNSSSPATSIISSWFTHISYILSYMN